MLLMMKQPTGLAFTIDNGAAGVGAFIGCGRGMSLDHMKNVEDVYVNRQWRTSGNITINML